MFQPVLKFTFPIVGQYDLLLIPINPLGIKLYLVRHLVMNQKGGPVYTQGAMPGFRPSAVPFGWPKLFAPDCWDKAMKPPWSGYFQPTPQKQGKCLPYYHTIPAFVQVYQGGTKGIIYGNTIATWTTPLGWGPYRVWYEPDVNNKSYGADNFDGGTTWWMSPTKPLVLLETGFKETSSIVQYLELGNWGVSISLNGSFVPTKWLLGQKVPNKLQLQGGQGSFQVFGPNGIEYEVHNVTAEYKAALGTKNFPFPLYRMKSPSIYGTQQAFSNPGGGPGDLPMLALRFGYNMNAPFKLEDTPPNSEKSTMYLARAAVVQFVVEGE